MLSKRILPCLDVKAGRVVKGVNFVNLLDAGDPVEMAQVYNDAGADELVFLDITATHEDRDIMIDVVYRTADRVFIPLTVGGGIQSLDTIRSLLRAGADKVSINSACPSYPWGNSIVTPFILFHFCSPAAINWSIIIWAPFTKSPN